MIDENIIVVCLTVIILGMFWVLVKLAEVEK